MIFFLPGRCEDLYNILCSRQAYIHLRCAVSATCVLRVRRSATFRSLVRDVNKGKIGQLFSSLSYFSRFVNKIEKASMTNCRSPDRSLDHLAFSTSIQKKVSLFEGKKREYQISSPRMNVVHFIRKL